MMLVYSFLAKDHPEPYQPVALDMRGAGTVIYRKNKPAGILPGKSTCPSPQWHPHLKHLFPLFIVRFVTGWFLLFWVYATRVNTIGFKNDPIEGLLRGWH